MKSFTDLEQSKVLSEIIPLESADMKILPFTEREYRIVPINDISVCGREDEIYAWSLAALLDVLPDYTLQTNTDGTVFVVCESKKPMISDAYDNPVDACCEMIIKLHELNLL